MSRATAIMAAIKGQLRLMRDSIKVDIDTRFQTLAATCRLQAFVYISYDLLSHCCKVNDIESCSNAVLKSTPEGAGLPAQGTLQCRQVLKKAAQSTPLHRPAVRCVHPL